MTGRQNRAPLFDEWASTYDRSVLRTDEAQLFPFWGYRQTLTRIAEMASAEAGIRVLDLGCGTGALSGLFVKQGCAVTGLDFAQSMLEIAWKRYPQATFLRADLCEPWPDMLGRRFERIVSSYTFHEFPLEDKVSIIYDAALRYLEPGGRIIIGDIAFPARKAYEASRRRWHGAWDDDEFYWVADEAVDALAEVGLVSEFEPVTAVAGIFSMAAAF